MRNVNITYILVSLLFLMPGCKKENTSKTPKESGQIVGTWELRQITGMMPPINYNPNNGTIIQFADFTYKKFKDGEVVETGTYSIIADTTVEESVCLTIKEGQFTNRVSFSNGANPNKIFFNIEGDELTFISGCFAYDAGSSVKYQKIQKQPL